MPKNLKKVTRTIGRNVNNRHNIKSFASSQEIASQLLSNSSDPRAQQLGLALKNSALITRQGATYARKVKKKTKK